MGYYSFMIKWKWFIVEGILLLLLGIFAIARPGIAAEALVQLFGWLFIFLGTFSHVMFGGLGGFSGAFWYPKIDKNPTLSMIGGESFVEVDFGTPKMGK